MSAIFGICHFSGEPVQSEHLERMNVALLANGERGAFSLHGGVGLGQRQMNFSPQDEFEHQPLSDADGRLVLVADARLDNRADLLGDLPENTPDSALILRAYQTWGVDAPRHLVGVFAFAIWDVSRRELFLARSPIMAPALFYHSTNPTTFAFASMPSGLHALPFVPRELNETKVAGVLAHVKGEPLTTLYRDILRLPSGHWMLVGADGLHSENYWRPDLTQRLRLPREEDYWEAFLDLFSRVTADQLRSSTPVGLLMSGGLDSTSVAAMAAPHLAKRAERLSVFTEVPDKEFDGTVLMGRYADETPLAQAVVDMYPNLDLTLMNTPGQFFMDGVAQLFPHLQAPFRNTSNRVWLEAILAEAGRRGIRVLLDGTQGNLTISRNGSGLLPELLSTGKIIEALRQVRKMSRAGLTHSTLRGLLRQGLIPLLPDPVWLAFARLDDPKQGREEDWLSHSIINQAFAVEQRIDQRIRGSVLRNRPRADMGRANYEGLASQDAGGYITAYRAMYGVETRTPTADVRLAEFCLSLPEEQFLHNGEDRRLVRRGMQGLLPPEVLGNHRRGLQAADWFVRLRAARGQVEQELARLEGSPLARRMLDLPRLRSMFERMPASDTKNMSELADYRFLFEPGLMTGRFLRWFESGE